MRWRWKRILLAGLIWVGCGVMDYGMHYSNYIYQYETDWQCTFNSNPRRAVRLIKFKAVQFSILNSIFGPIGLGMTYMETDGAINGIRYTNITDSEVREWMSNYKGVCPNEVPF